MIEAVQQGKQLKVLMACVVVVVVVVFAPD
jgi:hypothetical protein